MVEKKYRVMCIWTPAILVLFLVFSSNVQAATISATVKLGLCGDGVIDSGEQCDGLNLGGSLCVLRGFSGGSLSCTATCTFDTSLCTPGSFGGGSGGGGGGILRPNIGLVSTGATQIVTKVAQAKLMDIQKDGIINILDFNALMVNWGKTGNGNSADMNKDGVVDIFDFNILMVYWGIAYPL